MHLYKNLNSGQTFLTGVVSKQEGQVSEKREDCHYVLRLLREFREGRRLNTARLRRQVVECALLIFETNYSTLSDEKKYFYCVWWIVRKLA